MNLLTAGALVEIFLSLMEHDGENEIQIGQNSLQQKLGGIIPSEGLKFLEHIGAFSRSRSGNEATVYKFESREQLEDIFRALKEAAIDNGTVIGDLPAS